MDADRVIVAPHAGAWIETARRRRTPKSSRVAPHAGAWIETTATSRAPKTSIASRLTRARGLKRRPELRKPASERVAPHAGAWIETSGRHAVCGEAERRASRGRVD